MVDSLNSPGRPLPPEAGAIYAGRIIPSPAARSRAYIAHREARERWVPRALSGAPALRIIGIAGGTCHGLPGRLHPAAARSIRSRLEKLPKKGRMVEHESRWSFF